MSATKPVKRVALLTAGGLAPCLSAAVGALIETYSEVAPDIEIIAYRTLQFSTVALGAMFFVAIAYAVVQLVTGNYSGTACRTF